MSGIVRAVHQSSTKLGDTPLARLDLFESLPSRRFGCRASTTNSTQQNRALHRSTTQAPRHAADVELYSSTALYISTALQCSTLYILYTLPQGLRSSAAVDRTPPPKASKHEVLSPDMRTCNPQADARIVSSISRGALQRLKEFSFSREVSRRWCLSEDRHVTGLS